jgi:hypothetical protein
MQVNSKLPLPVNAIYSTAFVWLDFFSYFLSTNYYLHYSQYLFESVLLDEK